MFPSVQCQPKVLMVAEKPSIAQTLADALSPNRKYSSRTGAP